ncbi:MAG: alanine--tRNA ligase [Chloroflexi bacterium]|nr:alanine--tRNA ligase [Chloroflexota bacterium]
MAPRTSDEVREAFLRFFEERGHMIIPGSSLIPQGDPTLLLTSAGMVQFKPYFIGEAEPPSRRLASCQKCFRTTDIDVVGDFKHLTFFEMLGNFSIGDYFKKEAIAWGWEFVTQTLRLPRERLRVTIFLDDDEAFQYWRDIGVPAEMITRCGEEDNFWGPAGETGPCGPCSEIHYDFGSEWSCRRPDCGPLCDCGRFVEIWNLVFTQYFQHADGRRTPLPKPNIDTGMGLERVAAVMQGVHSFYESEVFAPVVQRVCGLAGRQYGKDPDVDHAVKIIVEHGRAATFLVGDGVVPSNEGRGYVLRRVVRRAIRYARKIGLDKPFLVDLAGTVIGQMSNVYPELETNREFIYRVLQLEEERFGEVLNAGLSLLDKTVADVKSKGQRVIPGREAFTLYDTYGFPRELTAEVAQENDLTIDEEGFSAAMEEQRERARAAHRFSLSGKAALEVYQQIGQTTEFVGYEKLQEPSTVSAVLVDGQPVETAYQGQDAEIVLPVTPFYGEMGGQVGDQGEVRGQRGKLAVTNTVRPVPGLIVHQGRVVEGTISVGDPVEAEVDVERRLDIARNHTVTHILQASLRQVLGSHVRQTGSLVAPDRMRFDFSHFAAMSAEERGCVQRLVNERIQANLPVSSKVLSYKEAVAEGAIALFDEKYGDTVRVMEVGRPGVRLGRISAELCGGTHVSATGEIGFFHILSEGSIGAGLRRIEAVTGRGAEKYVSERLSAMDAIAAHLQTTAAELPQKVAAVTRDLEAERRRAAQLQQELSKREAECLLDRVTSVDGVAVLAAKVSVPNMGALRRMGDQLRERLKSGVIVLGAIVEGKPSFVAMVTPDLVSKGFHAGQIVRDVAAVTGGGGGGRPEMAQAGGKDAARVDEALQLVARIVQE